VKGICEAKAREGRASGRERVHCTNLHEGTLPQKGAKAQTCSVACPHAKELFFPKQKGRNDFLIPAFAFNYQNQGLPMLLG
jgi:hypothetical protein